jgi:hypothetical protein
MVRIGGLVVDRAHAQDRAREYLSGTSGYAYPAYDGMDGGDPFRLTDGDLLAPALLNVTVRLPAFYSLTRARPHLENWLSNVPVDAQLAEAGPADLDLLGDLFAVLDDGAVPGVAGTTLAKVMHRKRPAFIPLHDKFVRRCYVGDEPYPVPKPRGRRTWAAYIRLLGEVVAEDLRREQEWFAAVAGMATGPAVTSLRALDIVAWRAGREAAAGHRGPVGPDPAFDDEDAGADVRP